MKSSTESATILIVEDSIDDYDAAIRSFKAAHLGNPVQWCRSGGDALDYLKNEGAYAQRPRRRTPALMLLDLNMPGIDGRRVLVNVKQDPLLKKIPVIILTTSSDNRDVTQCYELGASTYIQKPIDFDGLVAAVGRIKDYPDYAPCSANGASARLGQVAGLRGFFDGAEQGAVSERSQRAGV